MPPSQRSASFVIHFNPGTVPSMERRLYPAFKRNLVVTLYEVAQSIIAGAQEILVQLQAEHIPYDNVMGGRASGLMANSLTAVLANMMEDAVVYRLQSTQAYYWQWIEFGHFVHTKDGPKWWEGYHFFEREIVAHEKAIMAACRRAWSLAVIESQGTPTFKGLTNDVLATLSAKGS